MPNVNIEYNSGVEITSPIDLTSIVYWPCMFLVCDGWQMRVLMLVGGQHYSCVKLI